MRWITGFFGLAMLAAGCATVPAPPPVDNPAAAWQKRQTELMPVTTWKIRGRLAMRTADEGWQASVNWAREGELHRIDITGPLGRGHLRLVHDRHVAELLDADKRTWRAENAEQLLYRTTGWRVPLEGLNYWMLGLPSPLESASEILDDYGRLKTLIQSGWDIQFLEYMRYGTLDLPKKLFLKRNDPGMDNHLTGDTTLEVRLVIEHWALN